MATKHVVVDGSNIATEGRTKPSLKQLREAVSAFEADHKGIKITIVVDATFEHRVDPRERRATELAEERGEIVSPPAGAIGRGDAFLLRIAEKTGATVLSNDSFQEFHSEHKWLFETGRLIGGKPVAGVGWVFTERSPVRARKNVARSASPTASAEERVMDRAIAAATKEIVSEGTKKARKDEEPVNEPLVFIQFIAEHRIGTEVRGSVDRFTAHGAFVVVGNARCYIPLTGMGTPPPRSPRSVLTKGERRTFVIKAVNPARRDIELALPEVPKPKVDDKPEVAITAPENRTSRRKPKKTAKKTAKKAVKRTSRRPAKRTTKRTAKKTVARKRVTKRLATKRTVNRRAAKRRPKKPVPKKTVAKKNKAKKTVTKKSTSRRSAKRDTGATRRTTKKVPRKATRKPVTKRSNRRRK